MQSRTFRDRRADEDRRKAQDLSYRGYEKRSNVERRLQKEEKRSGWVRVTDWSSIRVEGLI